MVTLPINFALRTLVPSVISSWGGAVVVNYTHRFTATILPASISSHQLAFPHQRSKKVEKDERTRRPKRKFWTDEEIKLLIEEMAKGDGGITHIWLKHFGYRTYEGVRKKWKRLKQGSEVVQPRPLKVNTMADGEFLKAVLENAPVWADVSKATRLPVTFCKTRFWELIQGNTTGVLKVFDNGNYVTEDKEFDRETRNPFDVPIEIKTVKATLKFKGDVIAEIDQPVPDFSIPAHGSAPPPPMDLTMHLKEGSLGLLFSALGGEKRLNVASKLTIDAGLGYETEIGFACGETEALDTKDDMEEKSEEAK
ncbi:hypothetical protein BC829DRAFT_434791 [Chytridium lagenaria]|nr:hypothetical protein BC829DRAFT_434791 [Chytridium lagenaria]